MRFSDFIAHVKPNYKMDWFHGYMVGLIERAVREGLDVLCSAPPGFGKTELFSILLPSWMISEDTGTHIISLANSDGLARMAASNILRIIQSSNFQAICPLELDKATEQQFLVEGNDGRPTLHSAGINGQLTGHRARWIIYDDLTKSLADAYSETVRDRVWNNFNSCAETRLLPNGHIYGIQTRWSMADVHGRLIKRALESPDSRQFLYLSLAATNNGQQSFLMTTRTKTMDYLPAYPSLATIKGQPYSFSTAAIRGKQADLGPTIYSALYMQNPVATENQMFPPEVWRKVKGLNCDDYTIIITAWDTAARDKASNDPSANVVVGRRTSGDFVVLDYAEFKLTLDRLLPVVMERDRLLAEQFHGMLPLLAIEDASSGQGLIDIIRSQFPNVPLIAAKPVKSKIIRAEAVTPFTTARSVALLEGEWNAQFIADLANFPAGDRDHSVDAFVHAMRCFTGTGRDFQKPDWTLQAASDTDGFSSDELLQLIRGSDTHLEYEHPQVEIISPATLRAINKGGLQ
jgi:predicted phage terminase large subunit-like protein